MSKNLVNIVLKEHLGNLSCSFPFLYDTWKIGDRWKNRTGNFVIWNRPFCVWFSLRIWSSIGLSGSAVPKCFKIPSTNSGRLQAKTPTWSPGSYWTSGTLKEIAKVEPFLSSSWRSVFPENEKKKKKQKKNNRIGIFFFFFCAESLSKSLCSPDHPAHGHFPIVAFG